MAILLLLRHYYNQINFIHNDQNNIIQKIDGYPDSIILNVFNCNFPWLFLDNKYTPNYTQPTLNTIIIYNFYIAYIINLNLH